MRPERVFAHFLFKADSCQLSHFAHTPHPSFCGEEVEKRRRWRSVSQPLFIPKVQKIKQSIHIPVTKISSGSAQSTLWMEIYWFKSLCVYASGSKRKPYYPHLWRLNQSLLCISSVCVCVDTIRGLSYTHGWSLLVYTIHIHIKLMNKIRVTEHGIEKGARHRISIELVILINIISAIILSLTF